ncbi:MAG: tRNA lysidine(34) synthetase TilS [Mesorhizobium sp.]|uniref:tRNA lysidine(34) synthetase TilS n=2 Tax=Mesorhizobium TaxID=68287 RepID=UPI000FCC7EBA|nr:MULTISPECIES: tRNA lysidine(34) synthetase TilS [unclassified Mesorhizobium]RUV75202.1 tRNA lysidine(34) synthetase TilS [Mesorhizobium sp. M5C.F.Cr.IN.023.01.1.1]RWI38548.1 MAG: tRNA lysidine(34) synthetase TilS [Mesorhizobium sp.]RWI49423.1 MAG: tRNA lysidine(34) synthetase TilS [Mesorhizobium sp.]RWI58979.1 MAG: tRNA lysidine(34) synthetase TilS [Mesorhizobium sp.]RWI70401.1 MAG: tRNA lysidine(34) synthetase TilS [Mesorhizobium sp.]
MTLETEPDPSVFSQIDFTNGAVAAVSGGSDSTALLLLLKDHLDRTAPATKLLAVTIDHGLRPGSAAEAQAVARLCLGRGIAHRTLVWSGRKPSTGMPAAAREARYRLLAEAAQAEGIGLILTGHTADDQAETVLMRKAREDGARQDGRGLAGMAPATLYDWRIWIARPLLGTRRAALREVLQRANVGWVEDPTNEDEAFERPRIRAGLAGRNGTQRVEDAVALAARAAVEREQLGRRAAALIRGFASRPAAGLIRLDPGFATAGDEAAAVYALRILLATVGGVAFLPDQVRSEALLDRLRAAPFCATLSRTVIDARRAGLFLRRETRNLPPAAPAVDNALWDGRRRIKLGDEPGAFLIAPLGAARAAKQAIPEDGTPPSLFRAALAAEPVLWRASELPGECLGSAQDSPVLPGMAVCPVVAPFARFLPSFDLAPAGTVAALIGAPLHPATPFSGHTAG